MVLEKYANENLVTSDPLEKFGNCTVVSQYILDVLEYHRKNELQLVIDFQWHWTIIGRANRNVQQTSNGIGLSLEGPTVTSNRLPMALDYRRKDQP